MQVFNDIETIYQKGIIHREDDMHECSVCGKQFKTPAGAQRHYDRMNCHTYRNIFAHTTTEDHLYDIFKELMAVEGKNVCSKKKFRTIRPYTVVAKFFVFCYQNGVRDHYDYLEYALANTKWKAVMQGVHLACLETTLKDYRQFRRQTPDTSRDRQFFVIHEEQLRSDPNFVLRSLERGDITVSYLFGQVDLDEFLDQCTGAEEYRFEKFLEMVSG